jgi:hypothetical protein
VTFSLGPASIHNGEGEALVREYFFDFPPVPELSFELGVICPYIRETQGMGT